MKIHVPLMLVLAAGLVVAAVLVPTGRPALLGLAGVAVVIWLAARSVAKEAAAKAALLRDGLRGAARVRSVRQSAVQPRSRGAVNVELELDITVGDDTWPVERRERVPELSLARLAVDAVLPVYVDAKDRSRLLIDWGAPG